MSPSLQLANTLTGRKEWFEPLHPPRVTLYVCGVTVYDEAHLGHARGAVVFDLLRRYLEFKGYSVVHVRNITDVDDKIIERARALGESPRAIAKKYEESFKEQFKRLRLLPPTHEPRATEFIERMIQFIEALIARGVAYPAGDGVYFSVRKIPPDQYGELSHQRLDQMREGVRVEPGEGKRDPLDFALWKKAKSDEPSWPSPWGAGRPGWHIECSTMSTDLLGDSFDIHGGGQDLIFPHHENELAQARAVGKGFAQIWLHNGLLTVNGQKMSKSLGNFVTIPAVLERHANPDVLRLFFLSAHYRSPIDFTWERLDEAAHAYERMMVFVNQVEQLFGLEEGAPSEIAEASRSKFYSAMDEDLNTPEALAAVYELVARGGEWFGPAGSAEGDQARRWLRNAAKIVRELSAVLGVSFFRISELSAPILELMNEREEARQRKDFEKADQVRLEVKRSGFVLMDTGGRTVVVPDV